MAKRASKQDHSRAKVAIASGADPGQAGVRSRSGVSLGALFAAAGLTPAAAPSAETEPEVAAPDPAVVAPQRAPIDLRRVSKLVVRRVRKGRGGHTVTIVEGFGLGDVALGVEGEGGLHALAQDMKRSLGVAATVAEASLILHGDLMTRAVDWLEKHGVRRVVRGN